MAIEGIAPAMMTDRSCTASASASDSDTSRGDGEPRPAAGDEKKGGTTEPGVASLELKKLLREAPPEYLTLSLTPSSARAAAKYRRQKLPGEVSLAHVDAPRHYLSLSPFNQSKRRPDGDLSGGGGSVVADVMSSSAAEGALVVVEAMPPPLPPAQFPAKCLPPKKRKLAATGVSQETAGTAPASSPPCLALAIVNDHDGVYRSSSPPGAGGDGETLSMETMASHPIEAVPLQAVYVHGEVVPHQFRLGSGAGEMSNHHATAPPEPGWIREALGLPAEHQLVFISGKRVQQSDIDKQQSRFMIPRGETNDRLLPLLNPDECRAAGLHEPWERPKHEHDSDGERPRVQGKVHGGLAVPVVINQAGHCIDAKLTRWESTGSTVLKLGNAKSFADESGLRKDDHIGIWAFRRYGGLHLVITKIDGGTTGSRLVVV